MLANIPTGSTSIQALRRSLSPSIREAGVQFEDFVIKNLSIITIDRSRNGYRWITVSDRIDNRNKQKIKICVPAKIWQIAIKNGYIISDDVSIDITIDHLWVDNWCQLVITVKKIIVSGQSKAAKRKHQILAYCSQKGYFERTKKRLPFFIRNIAIVTSIQSTVETDITEQIGLRKEFINSYRFDGTYNDLSNLIHKLTNENKFDLVCLYRGGREDESMLVFSHEKVLDKIVMSPIPVVTALGHENDNPPVQSIADKAYDTPTRFALEINKHNKKAIDYINSIEWNIVDNVNNVIQLKKDFKKTIIIYVLLILAAMLFTITFF